MLQPRVMDGRRPSATALPLGIVSCFMLVLLLAVPGFSQNSDDPYVVHPTPALRLNNEGADLTTVLLLSNDNANNNRAAHGRFLNVKPTVGLLTSTARTFIQGGVTTEYATQVLGTTLDNGRLYAQLLKKSSRVLFDKDTQTETTPRLTSPSASTILPVLPINARHYSNPTFVLPNQKKFLQSHNDLVGDQDWQIIDDHLLVNNRNTFVGNTDYIAPSYAKSAHLVFPTDTFGSGRIRAQQQQPLSRDDVREIPASEKFLQNISNETFVFSQENGGFFVATAPDSLTKKIEAHKVQGALDLPTFTVKNLFAPSGYQEDDALSPQEELLVGRSRVGELRTPKVLYHHVRGQLGNQDLQFQQQQQQHHQQSSDHKQPAYIQNDDMRHLSTVTYYGFADFTTLVGETVIVFSPSTAAPSPNVRPITSIKGEATLNNQKQLVNTRLYEVKLEPAIATQQVIQPTVVATASLPTIQHFGVADDTNVRTQTHFVVGTHHQEKEERDDYETSREEENTTPNVTEQSEEKEDEQDETTEKLGVVTASTIFFPSDDDLLLSTINKHHGLEASVVTIDGESTETSFVDSSVVELDDKETVSPQSVATPPMLSTPSNEDIAKIFASLASAEAVKKASVVEATTEQKPASEAVEASSSAVKDEKEAVIQADTQVFGGVTTIFFEDDPFQAFDTTKSVDNVAPSAQVTTPVVTVTTPTTPQETEMTDSDASLEATTVETTPEGEEEGEEDEEERDTEEDCKNSSKVTPSIVPKTLTYLTTFFIPDGDTTSTSIESNVVVTYDVTYQTAYGCDEKQTQTSVATIEPTQVAENVKATSYPYDKAVAVNDLASEDTTEEAPHTEADDEEEAEETDETEADTDIASSTPSMIVTEKAHVTEEIPTEPVASADEESDGEIELLYKTLYTTYTYLTTFFHESTTSVSSHKEVVTNVITSTLGPSALQENSDVAQLLSSVAGRSLSDEKSSHQQDIESEIMATSVGIGRPTTKYHVAESDLQQIDGILRDEQSQSRTETLNDDDVRKNGVKTYYTTYTYFTTIFVDGETEITSRTEVYTNYVTGTDGGSVEPTQREDDVMEYTVSDDDNRILDIKPTSSYETILRPSVLINDETSTSMSTSDIVEGDKKVRLSSEVVTQTFGDNTTNEVITMVTDVQSTSSDGSRQIIENVNKQWNGLLEDQISSESNTEDILPSPTLLLQTSYTTFTYFTTMYIGSTASKILSRLETITNIATETLQPTHTIAADDATLPITYFTTFTYWTTLYKDGEITTLSREETVSSVFRPSELESESESSSSVIDVAPTVTEASLAIVPNAVPTEIVGTLDREAKVHVIDVNIKPTNVATVEPTIYYTTFTYYTTSYVGDETVLNSRFETVTNIVTPSVSASPRGINLDAPDVNALNTNVKPSKSVQPVYVPGGVDLSSSPAPTSTISVLTVEEALENIAKSSAINLAERVAAAAETPVETPPLEPSVLYLHEGKVVDAEGISTIFYTTRTIASTIDGTPTQVVESTSAIRIDEEKKAKQTTPADPSQRTYKTGLVRLIEGTMIANKTTTLYQSKVIGTIIDGRYAQIIESTSSFLIEKTISPSLSPTASLKLDISPTGAHQQNFDVNGGESSAPTPSSDAVESSIRENNEDGKQGNFESDDGDDDDEEGEDENGNVKSRLTFQTKKRTFTPVIRPFASRNRPQFAPKRKNLYPGSATIITRSDFTPTITATPALKTESSRGRFSSVRKSNSAVLSSSIGGSRKFSRPRSSLNASGGYASGSSSFPSGTARNRLSSSRIQPTSSYFGASSRRGGIIAGRSSSSRPFSSIYNGNSRLRVKPTAASSFDQNANTNIYTTQQPETDDETGVTQTLDEAYEEEEVEVTTPNTRRSNNPLLRFVRPPIVGAGAKPNVPRPQISTRRNPLSQRARTTTAPTTTTTAPTKPRPKTFQRPLLNSYQNRLRPSNSLFPPRGLFRGQANQDLEEENKKNEEDNNFSDDLETENGDYDDDGEEEEGDDDEEEEGQSNRRRRQSLASQKVKRRQKRQVDRALNFRSRFRRPTTARANIAAEERSDVVYEEEPVAPVTPKSRPGSRYTGRKAGQQASPHTTANRIRPTKASISSRAQFTLREKDTVTKPSRSSGFRRPTTSGGLTTSRRSTTISRPKAPRLKTYTNSVTDSPHPSRSSSGRSRQASRGRSTTRSRSRPTEYSHEPVSPNFDGTITVTHHIPTEITIPVVNGKVTEYKNVVTAKISTEVVPPNLYNTLVGRNGATVLALVREESNINNNGATEVTQFILHETPTTSIIFTPTSIRGRRTSFSHVVPSTVYDVEQVVSTIQPQIAANAPLANILLSQLLLGNIGLNQQNLNGLIGLGAQPQTPQTPTTEYKTRTTTYVTTVTNAMSTVIPLTFRGKEILTTIVDSSTDVITATEFLTDTIVVTPTMAAVQQVNSLLLPLLLQQQVQQQAQPNQLLPIQNSVHPQLGDLAGQQGLFKDAFPQPVDPNRLHNQLGIDDFRNVEDNDFVENDPFSDLQQPDQQHTAPSQQAPITARKRSRKGSRHQQQQQAASPSPPLETSVITLYVSGRRPGEFSTVLSTIIGGHDGGSSLRKRAAEFIKVEPSAAAMLTYDDLYDAAESGTINEYVWPTSSDLNSIASSQENPVETESLESVIGNVNDWFEMTSKLTGVSGTTAILSSEKQEAPETKEASKNSHKSMSESFLV